MHVFLLLIYLKCHTSANNSSVSTDLKIRNKSKFKWGVWVFCIISTHMRQEWWGGLWQLTFCWCLNIGPIVSDSVSILVQNTAVNTESITDIQYIVCFRCRTTCSSEYTNNTSALWENHKTNKGLKKLQKIYCWKKIQI